MPADPPADVLRWLRAFNAGRSDQVQFVGVEHYLTGPSADDAVEEHVARNAPQRLEALRQHLQVVRPTSPDVFAHIDGGSLTQWFDVIVHRQEVTPS